MEIESFYDSTIGMEESIGAAITIDVYATSVLSSSLSLNASMQPLALVSRLILISGCGRAANSNEATRG